MKGTFSAGNDCIKNCILNPNLMHNRYNGDYTYYNLWSADNKTTSANDNPVNKTIYDPCSVGFKLPAVTLSQDLPQQEKVYHLPLKLTYLE